eukprot:m.22680 g.22680  ORF g.22680 m.22680 type:complete len:332 (-) comp12980_c0_seq1:48-1043(-)
MELAQRPEFKLRLNDDTIGKYKLVAHILTQVIDSVTDLCLPATRVGQLCDFADQLLKEKLLEVFKNGDTPKGQAFPICVSVNNCVGFYSPGLDDTLELAAGDLIKIHVGAHIDGFIVVTAESHLVPADGEIANADEKNRALKAVHAVVQVVEDKFKSGAQSQDIKQALEKVATEHQCALVQPTKICNTRRFCPEAEKMLLFGTDHEAPTTAQSNFTIAQDEVYNINIVLSSGEGKLQEGDVKPFVYQRNLANKYNLRLKASRAVMSEITQVHPTMPFALRQLTTPKPTLGLKECTQHQLVNPFPVVYDKKGVVAHLQFTVLVTGTKVRLQR